MMPINSNTSSIPFKSSVAYGLLEIANQYPDREALRVGGKSYSYKALFGLAKTIASKLQKNFQEPRCLILSGKNILTYAGILGILLAGKTYVFLNPKDSEEGLRKIILSADSRMLITDKENAEKAEALKQNLNQDFQIFSFELDELDNIFYSLPEFSDRYAYLIFTSGSTGEPKGVPISHENLWSFLKNALFRINLNQNDRVSQINELSFDASVQEIFPCWMVGACLCVFQMGSILGLPKFIRDNAISFWTSVPSIIILLENLGRLEAGSFTSIRYSVFGGEVLTAELARKWKRAATNSIIENVYGPTETTVSILMHRWNDQDAADLVPIGFPFPDQSAYLIDQAGEIITNEHWGEIGEIILSGSQVAEGYWRNETMTKQRFINLGGTQGYKTGDLASWDSKFGLIYKGRIDDQVKIRGYRVELLEVASEIRSATGLEYVAVVPVKEKSSGNVSSLICFFSSCFIPGAIPEIILDEHELRLLCQKKLPTYMCPSRFIFLDHFPYNKNGKVDYKMLKIMGEAQ